QDLKNLGFTDAWMANHSHAEWIYRAYVRYIGAGAVACAGVMTLIKTLPTIVSAFRESVKSFGSGAGVKSAKRTESDLGMGIVVGGTVFLLDTTYAMGEADGMGGPRLAAPQATRMATIIKGLLAQNLPWAPVLVGVFLAFMAQMAGAHALSWAVGAYLPLST